MVSWCLVSNKVNAQSLLHVLRQQRFDFIYYGYNLFNDV